MERLQAVVLLAGSVRPSPLRKAIGRFVIELPIDWQHTLLDCWHEQLASTAESLTSSRFPVRVIVDRMTPIPAATDRNGPCEFRFEQDPFEFRGTGGLLSDLAHQYDEDDYLLVANASQILFEPLPALIETLALAAADLSMVCHTDGTPVGLMLVRCGCLRTIPSKGYIDLNEQALPSIAQDHDVRVVWMSRPFSAPIRTLNGYLAAVREYHQHLIGRDDAGDPYAEDWRASFGIVERGANVDQTAVIHDSVVLSGGRVEAGAVLVRAVVCPGGIAPQGKSTVDRLISGDSDSGLKGFLQ